MKTTFVLIFHPPTNKAIPLLARFVHFLAIRKPRGGFGSDKNEQDDEQRCLKSCRRRRPICEQPRSSI
jgi:hypothetical protein